jgi:hypothetical protein
VSSVEHSETPLTGPEQHQVKIDRGFSPLSRSERTKLLAEVALKPTIAANLPMPNNILCAPGDKQPRGRWS